MEGSSCRSIKEEDTKAPLLPARTLPSSSGLLLLVAV